MRKFYMSDIHGNYAAMVKLLEYANINYEKDQLVIGGDLINRGLQSGLVLRKLRKLQQTHPKNVHVISGNHEEMVRFYTQGINQMWILHGGIETMESFEETFPEDEDLYEHIYWITHLPLTHEDEDYVYVHAGLDLNEPLNNQPRDILWTQKKELYRIEPSDLFDYTNNKKVIHGHTASTYVTDDGVRISCDTGCEVLDNGHLSLVNLSENKFYSCSVNTFEVSETMIYRKHHK